MSTTLITGGTVVNATGSSRADVLVDGESIAAVLAPGSTVLGHDLAAAVDEVIDAEGKWVIPGMVDIHTHYDVEVLVSPGLTESVRHGITSVLVGSCSLSTIHASPSDAGDLFGRVEAIPRRHVVETLDEKMTWTSAQEYVAALEALPLGPNVAAFIGHSDIRAAELGLDRATRKDVTPSPTELAAMEAKLEEALDAGCHRSSSCSTSSTARSAAPAPCPRRTRRARSVVG